jgi:hypothetical protein
MIYQSGPITKIIQNVYKRQNKMIISANQPYFAPYPGFFYKIETRIVLMSALNWSPLKKPEYIYAQMWGDLIAKLSTLDMMFTCGAKSRDIVMG